MLKVWLLKILPLWGALFLLLICVPVVGVAVKYSDWIKTAVLPDFREGKVSAIESVPIWLRRSQLNFLNSLSLFRGDSIGLPVVNLFVPESSTDALLSNLPSSSKRYQPGKLLFSDGKIRPIKVRLRGDNGRNYLLKKKSWRIKTAKSSLYRGGRKFSFHVPRRSIPIEAPAAYSVAKLMDLTVPDFRLVELIVNGKNHGVFLELMHLNEEFLRKNGFMPVEIIKADREIGDETNSTNRVWQNPSMWKLLAKNSRSPNPKDLLNRGIHLLNAAEFSDTSYAQLKGIFPIKLWAKFGAQDILLNNFHTANHNLRIIADDQTGFISPIIWDPDPRISAKDNNLAELFNRCSVAVICLYKQSSEYRTYEFNTLYHTLKDRVLSRVANDINKDAKRLTSSINRDAYRFDVQPRGFDLFGRNTETTILNFAELLRAREALLLRHLEKAPRVTWSKEQNRLDIFIEGTNPIDSIYLSGTLAKDIYYDANNNGLIDHEDKKMVAYFDKDRLIVDVTLLPNLGTAGETLATRFSFLADVALDVDDVEVGNAFTNEKHRVTPSHGNFQVASPRNVPVSNKIARSPVIIDGVFEVKQNLVTDQPYVFLPGTTLLIHPNASVVFRRSVDFLGSVSEPITITSYSDEPFGVVAIHGEEASNSRVNNVRISNGSQANINGTAYLAMFSIHDTHDIALKNFKSTSNTLADDMFHVVYGNNILLKDAVFQHAEMDAIDIDLSTVTIDGVTISNAGNDCIDVMGGDIQIKRASLTECGDKGVSIGENSNTLINGATIENTVTGVAAKDGSRVQIANSTFTNNLTHIDGYKKNWRYGSTGANVLIDGSTFSGAVNHFRTDAKSSVEVTSSKIPLTYTTKGNIAFLP